MKQHTVAESFAIHGIGIHSGKANTCRVHPAPVGTGLVFEVAGQAVPVRPDALAHTARATLLEKAGARVQTPEHFLAACYGLCIANLRVELDHPEVPVVDGSANAFVEAFVKAGLKNQETPWPEQVITTPGFIEDGDKKILFIPSSEPRFTYVLSYPDTFIGTQVASVLDSPESFIQDIAPARTYGFYHEVAHLLEKGLAQGGSLDNAVIIKDDGYLNPLRFPDELARHKVLDMIGDFAILGRRIRGHVVGIGSGHALNAKGVLFLNSIHVK
ncbi:MAG: UDP-3-O-acyl-N-acetylglucosamine deacetylase [Candidatus Margulisiibacteriota bacterium]